MKELHDIAKKQAALKGLNRVLSVWSRASMRGAIVSLRNSSYWGRREEEQSYIRHLHSELAQDEVRLTHSSGDTLFGTSAVKNSATPEPSIPCVQETQRNKKMQHRGAVAMRRVIASWQRRSTWSAFSKLQHNFTIRCYMPTITVSSLFTLLSLSLGTRK